MCNMIFIKDKRVCIKPLRNTLEAIQKLQPPNTVKRCRSFAEMVNFLSMFCPELQISYKILSRKEDRTRIKEKEIKIPKCERKHNCNGINRVDVSAW